MITDEEKREAVDFLRSGKCLYFAEHRKTELDCSRCMKVSTMLFGHYDALCGLDSYGNDAWQRLADLIDRPTCRLELTDVETHGNAKVRIYECSECGRTCEEIYGKYERCPHCGAVVTDD